MGTPVAPIAHYAKTLETSQKAEKSRDTEKIHLRHLQRFIEQEYLIDPFLKDVNIGFFNQYKRFHYNKGIRTDTVNREITTLRILFQEAADNNYLEENIAKQIKCDQSQIPSERFRTHKEILTLLNDSDYTEEEIAEIKRYRYLTPEEIHRLLGLVKNTWLYPIFTICALMGLRRGEVTNLEYRHIDWKRKFLEIGSRKQSLRVSFFRCSILFQPIVI